MVNFYDPVVYREESRPSFLTFLPSLEISHNTPFFSPGRQLLERRRWSLHVCPPTTGLSPPQCVALLNSSSPSWEFLTTLDYEWSVIRGHRPYRWTIWVGQHTLLFFWFFWFQGKSPGAGNELIFAFW